MVTKVIFSSLKCWISFCSLRVAIFFFIGGFGSYIFCSWFLAMFSLLFLNIIFLY